LILLDFIVQPANFLPVANPESLSPRVIEALCAAQAEAAQVLGRLDGILKFCPPEPLRIAAARIIRETLVAALRQEGHQFTDARFHAWFAGLVPLSEEALRFAPAPRAIVETLLLELAHSSWQPLAETAAGFQTAFLALREPDDRHAREAAEAAIAEARAIVATLKPAPLPYTALGALHRAIGQSIRFAQAERSIDTIAIDNIELVLERPRPPSPRWAIELAFGRHMRISDMLYADLPLPGLIRLDTVTLENDEDLGFGAILQAKTLKDCLIHILQIIDEAARYHAELPNRYAARRGNSRAPLLCGVLTGFGPLRSSQIEHLIGATRLGVRAIIKALADTGELGVETVAGVKLYSARRPQPLSNGAPIADERHHFSSAAIDAYDASMSHIDALLARHANPSGAKN